MIEISYNEFRPIREFRNLMILLGLIDEFAVHERVLIKLSRSYSALNSLISISLKLQGVSRCQARVIKIVLLPRQSMAL